MIFISRIRVIGEFFSSRERERESISEK